MCSPKETLSDIKTWLKSALIEENLEDFSVNVLGNSEKGDGYMGDIIFVNVSEKTVNNTPKKYDLVLKCGKKSQALRDSIPVRETFENEIYLYTQVFAQFKQFQINKGLFEIFDSVPRCYGVFINDNTEVIVLENLKMLGYSLFDRKIPLTIDHINLIVGEYGKWHAISAAMQDQNPDQFSHLASGIKDLWSSFDQSMDMLKFFAAPIEEVYNLIKSEISENVGEKLKNLKSQISYVMRELIYDRSYFSVITHGDAWNNNFMFKYQDTDEKKPLKVAMLDWQMSKFTSPVVDLSYFLYSCISSEGIKVFDEILKSYHNSFSDYVRRLGSDPEKIYPFSQFLADWKVFSRFGIIMAFIIIKIAVTDKDEVADVSETAENGIDISEMFLYNLKDKSLLKSRILCIIEHIVERGFI